MESELCPRCGAYWRPCDCDEERWTTEGCVELELPEENDRLVELRLEMAKAIMKTRETRLL